MRMLIIANDPIKKQYRINRQETTVVQNLSIHMKSSRTKQQTSINIQIRKT